MGTLKSTIDANVEYRSFKKIYVEQNLLSNS